MKSLILFGFKACGKTHFGKLLASRLNWRFIDTDDLLVNLYQEKATPHEIHKALGEKAFRELENKAIQTLRPHTTSVIALGGGSLLNIDNVAHLQKVGQLVYLKTPFSTLQTRILKDKIPSFIDTTSPLDSLLAIYEKRRPLYESIDAHHIDIGSLDEGKILEKLHLIATQQERLFYGL